MKLSALSLVPVRQGQTHKQAIETMLREAKFCEELGFERYWIAEHHNIKAYASSATQILVSQILHHTDRIKVGAGGVMLPNHAPLLVAEQYGTLATLYSNRVEIGIGRAKGTDPFTARALRRQATNHDQDVAELQSYFGEEQPHGVNALPGAGTNVPLYVLGSSVSSAYFAAEQGLPYVFASHFMPMQQKEAMTIYRQNFKPSQYCSKPYVIFCWNLAIADTDEEAHYNNSTLIQLFLNEQRGINIPVQPPLVQIDYHSAAEKRSIEMQTAGIFIGSKESATKQYAHFCQEFAGVDEIMCTGYIWEEEKMLNSYRLFKEIIDEYQG
ncbi:LLM class flavin-dependent oxidoreductase [Mannheimia sp. E30BD]|uniref:LLM class flavin-dependent oxidoreductase n=1 Tax=Mannheimia sp. E30BD TaxID=3278708 RepID=UPI00359DD274